jgi:WD40 repeat protein
MRAATGLVVVLASGCLGTTAVGRAADQPAREGAAREPALPPGALRRLGSERFRLGETPTAALLAPDGKHAAVLTQFRGVCWMDLTSGRVVYSKADYRPYNSEDGWALSPDGKVLASLSAPQFIQLWDVEKRKALQLVRAQHPPKSVSFSPDGKTLSVGEAAGKDGEQVSLWDVATGNRLRTLSVVQNLSVRSAFSPDGDVLATWGNMYSNPKGKEPSPPQTIQLWEVSTGKELRRVVIAGDRAEAVAFSPDGKVLAILTFRSGVEIREAASGKLVRQFPTQLFWGRHVRFTPDGRFLVAVERFGKAQVWDTATWKSRRLVGGPDLRVCSLAFPGKQVLACCVSGQTVEVRDLLAPPKKGAAVEHRHAVRALQFLSRRSLLSADTAGQVFLWEVDAGKPLAGWGLYDQLPRANRADRQFPRIAVGPGGTYLAAFDFASGQVHVWDLHEKKRVWSLPVPRPDPNPPVALGADGKLAVLTRELKDRKGSEAVVVGDVEGRREVRRLALPAAPPSLRRFGFGDVAFSPDGQLLAAAIQHNQAGKVGTEVFVWDLKTGYEKRHLLQETSYTPVLAFSPDGSLLALGGPTEGVALVHVWTGNLVRLEGVDRSLDAVAFAPDGRTVAGASYHNKEAAATVYVWERLTGTLRCRYQGHGGKVYALAYAPGAAVLASAGFDGTVLLWDLTGSRAFAGPKGELRPAPTWSQLAQAHAGAAFPAMGRLAARPGQAVALLREQLGPDRRKGATPEQMRKWIGDLEDDSFKVRELASQALKEAGERALPELHRVMKTRITLEARVRIEHIMGAIQGLKAQPEELRQRRAVEVLEHIGGADARRLLEEFAGGSAGAALTEEARAALVRMKQTR